MNRRQTRVIRATIGLVAFLTVAAQAWSITGAASDTDLEQTIGTLKAVDADARQVLVLTGCGHALRVVVFHAGTECRIAVGGAGAKLENLRRGQIVAVRHRKEAQRRVAVSISTLPAPEAGRPR